MSNLFFSNKNQKMMEYYEESSEGDSGSDYENDHHEFQCKNIDPALAKLMGIIIKEQSETTDWKPPSKSGLDNSEEIVPSMYFQNKNVVNDIDFFKIIKHNIINYKTLTDRQLEYIKNLNNAEKYELIEIYNKLISSTIHKK